jgi:trans-aconitate methyltransferase
VEHKKIRRTHDKFYLLEKKDSPPKESFKAIANLISKEDKKNLKILDIGCANGSFSAYLKNRFPNFIIEGMEFLPELVEKSQMNFPNLNFFQGSILETPPNEKINNYDVVTALGVVSIFDNVELIFKNLLLWIKPGGKIYIHGMFNREDIDVYIKYKHAEDLETSFLESGWNIVSLQTCKKIFYALGAKKIILHDFHLDIDLSKREDPVRSWTIKLENGQRVITNGLCILQPQGILEIIT